MYLIQCTLDQVRFTLAKSRQLLLQHLIVEITETFVYFPSYERVVGKPQQRDLQDAVTLDLKLLSSNLVGCLASIDFNAPTFGKCLCAFHGEMCT